ncbi:MAG: hypothetical protein RR272_00195 [Synergistaceae bacterium]
MKRFALFTVIAFVLAAAFVFSPFTVDSVSSASKKSDNVTFTNRSGVSLTAITVVVPGKNHKAVEVLKGKPLADGDSRIINIEYIVSSPYRVEVKASNGKANYVEKRIFYSLKFVTVEKGLDVVLK